MWNSDLSEDIPATAARDERLVDCGPPRCVALSEARGLHSLISELESHSFVQNNMCGSHQSPVGATGTSVVGVGRWCEYPLNASQVGMTSGNDIDTRLVSMYVSIGATGNTSCGARVSPKGVLRQRPRATFRVRDRVLFQASGTSSRGYPALASKSFTPSLTMDDI